MLTFLSLKSQLQREVEGVLWGMREGSLMAAFLHSTICCCRGKKTAVYANKMSHKSTWEVVHSSYKKEMFPYAHTASVSWINPTPA